MEPEGEAPKGGGPEGWRPKPRKSGAPKGGPRKVGPPKGGGPEGWSPEGWGGLKFRAFFPFSRHNVLSSFSLLGSFRGILVVFEAPGP